MNDYISREAAISMFAELQELANKRVCDTPADSPCYMRYVTQARERDDTVRRLIELPAADVRPVRWIRTSERMPEEGGKYLCVWQGKSIDTGYFFNGHFRLYGEIKDHLVSHWMPLPELPHCGADMRGEQNG